ncbi:MAG: amidohydrolase family protein [Thermodesulfobacteriota bacterium]|nr:amidohydrolase family protein [Thermodesulfobacteriota bacterium]
MIIDCHTHIFPDGVRKDRESFCQRDEGFSSIYRDSKARVVGAEELIASMDESGIEKSVICGFPWHNPELCFLHNQYLLESASRYTHRLIVFISLLFSNPDWSAMELERGMKDGAKGVGEIALYDQEMTSQDIESMSPVLREMEKQKIPLLLHTNEHLGHAYPGKGKTPLELFYQFALTFPCLPIILAHWGGGLPFYELMPEVSKAMTNVYYDTAASPFLYSKKIYAVVSEIVGAEKILFGSDYPLIRPRRYFQELEESGLSEEDREKILGLNFSKLIEKRGQAAFC